MTRTTALLSLLCFLGPCSRSAPRDGASTSRPAPAARREKHAMSQPASTIPQDQLKDAVDSRGFVAVVRVIDVTLEAPGTRSEAVRVSAEVERLLHGKSDPRVTLHRYTSGGNRLLDAGNRYIVAVSGPGEGNMIPMELIGFVEVSEASQAEAIAAHERLIGAATKKP